MKLTILGSRGGYPTEDFVCSSYLLEVNGTNILFDMGTGSLSRLLKTIDVEKLDAIIISHLHFDHCSDLLDFQYLIQMQKGDGIPHKQVKVYMPKEPSYLFDVFTGNKDFDVFELYDKMEIKINGINIKFFRTSHPVMTFASRLTFEDKVFVYTGDASYTTNNLFDIVNNADLAVLDCGNLKKYKKEQLAHMTPEQCYNLIENHKIKNAVLSHIIPHYSIEDYEAETVLFDKNKYIIAIDGLVIDF